MSRYPDRIDAGMDVARVSAAEADRIHREERQADARKFLLDRDLVDVAEALGLVEPATPSPKARRRIGGAQ